MIAAKEQPAPVLSPVRIASTHMDKASIDLLLASRMIAIGRHPVADIAFPLFVVAD